MTSCDCENKSLKLEFIQLLPLIICVHALAVSGHLLQLPVPSLHPPGAVVALLDQHLKQSMVMGAEIKTLQQIVNIPMYYFTKNESDRQSVFHVTTRGQC